MTKKQFFTLAGICLLGFMLMLASLFLKSHKAGVEWDGSAYNIENVNPVDAKFARPYNETLDTIGDVFVVFSGLIVVVSVFTSFFASKDKSKGFKIAFVDSLFFGISWLYGNSFYRMLKILAGRIRPYMYFENPSQKGIEKGDFFLSWPSGHSANVFMAFGFLLTWFTVRYADSKLKKPVLTFTFAVCVTTMILRMLSGNHFMTDVLSGAAIGCVSGYFISALCYRINGEKK